MPGDIVSHLTKNKVSSLVALFLGLTLLATLFLPGMKSDFLYLDDQSYISSNETLVQGFSLDSLRWAFTADLTFDSPHSDYWQPITTLSRLLDIELFGLNATGHRSMNLFLHVLNSLLLFCFLHLVFRRRFFALFATFLFMIHPLKAEPVLWVYARKDLLYSFFLLFGLNAFFLFKKDMLRIAALALCFVLALLSKPAAISFPFLITLLCLLQLGSAKGPIDTIYHNRARLLLPLVICTLMYLPIPFIGQPQALEFGWLHHLAKIPINTAFYLRKFFFPYPLFLYGPVPVEPISLKQWIACGFTLTTLLVALASVSLRAHQTTLKWPFVRGLAHPFHWLQKLPDSIKPLWFGLLWFLIFLIPVIALPWPADRFLYLPSAGLCMSAAYLICLIPAQRLRLFVSGIILIITGSLTFHQSSFWRDSIPLFEYFLKNEPRNYAIENNLGFAYFERGEYPLAEEHLRKALKLKGNEARTLNNLAALLAEQGRFDEAEPLSRLATEADPLFESAWLNRVRIYEDLGKNEAAIKVCHLWVLATPNNANAHRQTARLLDRKSEYQDALDHLLRYYDLHGKPPVTVDEWVELGRLHGLNGDIKKAEHCFQKASSLDPNHPLSIMIHQRNRQSTFSQATVPASNE